MKVKKKELLGALEMVRPGLSEKAIIEQTDYFVFDDDFIRTYNDEIAISYPIKSGFCMAIKADEFFRLVSKIEAEEIDFSVKDGFLNIVAGKSKGMMVTVDEIKCPKVLVKSRRWFPLPVGFVEAIRFCSFSADRSLLMTELSCLLIKDDYVLSSDNYRATKYEMGGKLPEFLLQANAAKELSKYLPVYYALESGWIHFKDAGGIIFSGRVIEGTYPEEILGLFKPEGDMVSLPEGLKGSVERARIFTREGIGGGSDLIQVKVNESGQLICRGEGALGWIEDVFEVSYKKKGFEIRVSPDFLIEILNSVGEMRVSDDKLYFSGEKFKHVISLV